MNVPDWVAVPLIVKVLFKSSYPNVNPPGKPPATILIALVLEVDLYTMGVIALLIQIVGVEEPLCKVMVAFGLTVMLPVVVEVTHKPAVAMV